MYLPWPLPDELIGGVLERGSLETGLPPKRFRRWLGPAGMNYSSPLVPSGLPTLADDLGLDAETLLWRHTMFPYAVAAMAPEEVERLRAKALGIRPGIDCLGSISGVITRGVRFRRACAVCVARDRANHGRAYWHRSHLLPAVHVCPIHDERLVETPVPLRSHLARMFVEEPPLRAHRELTLETPRELLLVVARMSAALLEGPPARSTMTPGHYRELAFARGYRKAGTFVASRVLVGALHRAYGKALLTEAAVDFDPQSGRAWPALMLRDRETVPFATVKHILLSVFLEGSWTDMPEVSYPRPGRVPADRAALDAKMLAVLQKKADEAIRRHYAAGTVASVLSREGMWHAYRHERQSYPKTTAWVGEHRYSKKLK